MELNSAQWAIAISGALLVGLGKGGLPGAGNITIWLYALVFGSKQSVGLLLPVLICADIVAVLVYRKHAEWVYIKKLFPLAAIGVVVGFFIFDRMSSAQMNRVIGVVLLGMTVLHFVRKGLVSRRGASTRDPIPHTWWFVSATGLVAGVATMVANAAGPVAGFYFMSVRLPKIAFIGTSAWFFLCINLFKMPFQIAADNVSLVSLKMSLTLGVFAALGAVIAPHLVKLIPQKLFESLVWAVIVFAALKMIV